MAKICIRRAHSLPDQEVRRHVTALSEQLAAELAADYQWQGDALCFKHKGASGTIRLEQQAIQVDVQLGLLLRPFRGKVEGFITEYLDEHIG